MLYIVAQNREKPCLRSDYIRPERSTKTMLQEARGPLLEVPPISTSSKYVQQLFQGGEPATPASSVQQELLQLKAQITDAAASLELERQAYQRARVHSSAQQLQDMSFVKMQTEMDRHACAMHAYQIATAPVPAGHTVRPRLDRQQVCACSWEPAHNIYHAMERGRHACMHACVHGAACLPNQERSAQEEDQAVWAQVRRKEEQRLHRERAILGRQSQVLLKLPTKKEKAEVCRLPSPWS